MNGDDRTRALDALKREIGDLAGADKENFDQAFISLQGYLDKFGRWGYAALVFMALTLTFQTSAGETDNGEPTIRE